MSDRRCEATRLGKVELSANMRFKWMFRSFNLRVGSRYRNLSLGDTHRVRNVFTDTSVSSMRVSGLAGRGLCRYMLTGLKSRVDFTLGAVGKSGIDGFAVAGDEDRAFSDRFEAELWR